MSSFFDFSISRLSNLPLGGQLLHQTAIEDLIEMETFPLALSSLVESRRAIALRSSPTPAPLTCWYEAHFKALDIIDAGERAVRFLMEPDTMLDRLQPLVARALLANSEVFWPQPTSTTLADAQTDEPLMERLIAAIDWEKSRGQDRLFADVTVVSSCAQPHEFSRFHIARKFVAAELIGCLGWTGRRARSPLWISRDFYKEYARIQARTLRVLDDAFADVSVHHSPAEPDLLPHHRKPPTHPCRRRC